jgi:hypothetical protein
MALLPIFCFIFSFLTKKSKKPFKKKIMKYADKNPKLHLQKKNIQPNFQHFIKFGCAMIYQNA